MNETMASLDFFSEVGNQKKEEICTFQTLRTMRRFSLRKGRWRLARCVMPSIIDVYIENHGLVKITQNQISAIHDGKVVLAIDKSSDDLRAAIEYAHDRELDDVADREKNDPKVS